MSIHESTSNEITKTYLEKHEVFVVMDKHSVDEEFNTVLTAKQAWKIAKDYQEKYNLSGSIHDDFTKSVMLYQGFPLIKGYAWLVTAELPPNSFEGLTEMTYVISDCKGTVNHTLDHHGTPYYAHLPNKR